jgi:hypothetical protein
MVILPFENQPKPTKKTTKKMTKEQLFKVLRLHGLWLKNDKSGIQANCYAAITYLEILGQK